MYKFCCTNEYCPDEGIIKEYETKTSNFDRPICPTCEETMNYFVEPESPSWASLKAALERIQNNV